MRKKHLLLCFLLLTLFTLSGGCSHFQNPSSPKEDEVKFSESMNLSIAFWDITNMENAQSKDRLWSFIEEKFNINIQPISLNWSNYNDQYLIMAVSDTLPDIFPATAISGASTGGDFRLSSMVERGLLRPLPDDLSSYPEVESVVEMLRNQITYSDGRIYTFPRMSFVDPTLGSSDAGLIVRKDWLKSLGLGEPKSLEEFIEMASAFANNDPDGNGIKDTIGFNCGNRLVLGKWLALGVAPQLNIVSWTDEGGRFIPTYLSDGYLQIVLALRKLYETGGLDPAFHLKKPADVVYDFAKGKLGALEYKISPATIAEVELYWNQYHDGDNASFEECVGLLNIFPASDGKYYSNSSTSFWSETLFSSRLDDKKTDRILHLFNYLLSDEGWMLTRFGLEKEDYSLDNGRFTCLIDTSSDSLTGILNNRYASLSLFESLASWGGTEEDFIPNEQNVLRYGSYAAQLAYDALKWSQEHTLSVERPEEIISMIKPESKIFTPSLISREVTQIIIEDGDPAGLWDNLITRLRRLGLDEYVESVNRYAAQMGIYSKTKTEK